MLLLGFWFGLAGGWFWHDFQHIIVNISMRLCLPLYQNLSSLADPALLTQLETE